MLGKGSRQMKEVLSLFLLQCLNTKKRKQEKNPQEILQLSLLRDMHFCFRDRLKWFFSLIKKILAFLILLYFHANIVNTVFSDCTQLLNWREIYSTWKNNLLQSMKMSEDVKISYTNPAEILLFINLLYFVQMKFNHNIPLLFSFPSFLLFLVRFANANRSSFSSSSSLCRLPCWETPSADLLSSPHMLIHNCLTSLLLLLQQWILTATCSAVQTTEIPLPLHHRNLKDHLPRGGLT